MKIITCYFLQNDVEEKCERRRPGPESDRVAAVVAGQCGPPTHLHQVHREEAQLRVRPEGQDGFGECLRTQLVGD